MKEKNISSRTRPAARTSVTGMAESIIGCKWTLTVLSLVRRGVNRPGAIEHAVPGLSSKVLNERLRKLTRYGILDKHSFPEIPPRVEYHLTGFGCKFVGIIDLLDSLQSELDLSDPDA